MESCMRGCVDWAQGWIWIYVFLEDHPDAEGGIYERLQPKGYPSVSQWMAFVWEQHKAPAGSDPKLSGVVWVDLQDRTIERVLRSPRPNPKVDSDFQVTWEGGPDPEITASGKEGTFGNLDYLVPVQIRALVFGPRHDIRHSIVISLQPKLIIDTDEPNPSPHEFGPVPSSRLTRLPGILRSESARSQQSSELYLVLTPTTLPLRSQPPSLVFSFSQVTKLHQPAEAQSFPSSRRTQGTEHIDVVRGDTHVSSMALLLLYNAFPSPPAGRHRADRVYTSSAARASALSVHSYNAAAC
ncbi:hypothetical protein MAPG_10463 [Magnaporthiopsis poae ATCC 64411]|uniref:Uncharacterized protein n=1 Tax=Magnaporthiopsis poae (strain ATCC 64411 / 73-15) TaxID=644358 RepID=A0A0C4ECN2_MAGP6|nr:hypothetical protein MAPG_10463 [Magnaporthiopsis poae ATCC 64411]